MKTQRATRRRPFPFPLLERFPTEQSRSRSSTPKHPCSGQQALVDERPGDLILLVHQIISGEAAWVGHRYDIREPVPCGVYRVAVAQVGVVFVDQLSAPVGLTRGRAARFRRVENGHVPDKSREESTKAEKRIKGPRKTVGEWMVSPFRHICEVRPNLYQTRRPCGHIFGNVSPKLTSLHLFCSSFRHTPALNTASSTVFLRISLWILRAPCVHLFYWTYWTEIAQRPHKLMQP